MSEEDLTQNGDGGAASTPIIPFEVVANGFRNITNEMRAGDLARSVNTQWRGPKDLKIGWKIWTFMW